MVRAMIEINPQRLIADNYIGDVHISVQRHISNDYPLHWHNYFEIEFLLSGSGIYTYNNEQFPINKGDAYILTPSFFHGFKASVPVELINISFDEQYLTEDMRMFLYAQDSVKNCSFVSEDYNRFVMASKLLLHEIEFGGPCIGQLLEYILSRFSIRDKKQSKRLVSREHLSGINNAISYMELHFREKLSLTKLSKLSGYNPTYFSELYRKTTGETYIERLKKLRINYAKMLLSNGMPVSDACFLSGFTSLSNFLTTFKQLCGITPSEYRKSCNRSNYLDANTHLENSL